MANSKLNALLDNISKFYYHLPGQGHVPLEAYVDYIKKEFCRTYRYEEHKYASSIQGEQRHKHTRYTRKKRMKLKSILVVASVLAGSNAITCDNEGLERCAAPSGSGDKIIRCENGREVLSFCTENKKCYGNGSTGVMCIDPEAAKPIDKRAIWSSPFGGYTTQLNNLLRGVHGDASSLNTFISSARSAMFTNKNSVVDVSNTFGNGFQKDAANIKRNSGGLFDSFRFSYLIADFGNNVNINPNARASLSRSITSGGGIVASASPSNMLKYADTYRALTNMARASNTYYPNTLGLVLNGNLSPSTLATYLSSANAGNANGTAFLLRSVFQRVGKAQPYVPAFSHASGKLSRSISSYANTGIVRGVMNRYKPATLSRSNNINFFNGIANGIFKTGGSYKRDFSALTNLYGHTVDSICGCSDSATLFTLFYYLGALLFSIILFPIAACCGPSGGSAAVSV
ncbi:hypothetical protein BB560_005569 [Smittium megazygosporum]|uniref:Uncharacterized protein n=1 Tax=Smittium megazygosporum TaxID=133381 RepID=A0A2T9Z346_9FUNG|nr:hypothetical protein BB560_005569 [Smittium megazygosporum]